MESSSTSSSSPFRSFKSKKILGSDQKPATPVTPLRQPRRRLMSVKEVREEAIKLRSGRESKGNESGGDVVIGSGHCLTRKGNRKSGSILELPDKCELLCTFFDSLHSSLRLLRMKGQAPSLKNISLQIECLTDKRFSIVHLAQFKFIMPEAVELKKVLVHDEKTFCMKPDLHVTLNVNAIENVVGQKKATEKPDMKRVFRSRVSEFLKSHPEKEIPEAELPEPFNRSKININISSEKASVSTLLNKTTNEVITEQTASVASHLPNAFQKRFSKQVSSQSLSESISNPITQVKTSLVVESQASVPLYPFPETPIKGINSLENEVYFSKGTPLKVDSTPVKLMSATPALPTPKRCYMTPNAKLTNSPNKLARRSNRNKSLNFDTLVESANVDDEVKSSAGNFSSDDEIYDILPNSLVQSIKEKELKIQEENDPAISQAKRRQQMLTKLPSLFDMIRYSFQSSKSLTTKEELLHKLMTSQLGIVDKKEVEEQFVLLKELAPDFIYEKLASSGDLLIGINKISSPELIRARLVEAK